MAVPGFQCAGQMPEGFGWVGLCGLCCLGGGTLRRGDEVEVRSMAGALGKESGPPPLPLCSPVALGSTGLPWPGLPVPLVLYFIETPN